MRLSEEERRALGVVLALLFTATGARWLERPRDLALDGAVAVDIAALEHESRAARPSSPGRGRGKSDAAGAPGPLIDPNTASVEELQRLPGVGPAMAARIAAERDARPFASAAELQRVRGIGPAQASKLAEYVSLPADGPTPSAAAGTVRGAGLTGGQMLETPRSAPAGAIDLNRASAAELQTLSGVGPVLAARLVARRDSAGGFADWAAVDAVPGVGPALLARLKAQARLGP
jgi:competence protein ComEA